MTDPRRLGKRAAYRLGEPSAPAPGPARASAPRAPSFGSRRSRKTVAWWLAGCAAAAALLGLAAWLGWWFGPFVAGIIAGAGPWRVRPALALVLVGTAVGWGGVLWWPSVTGAPAGATARAVAALAGLPPHAAIGVAGTLLVGIVQAVFAFWLARAVTHRWR